MSYESKTLEFQNNNSLLFDVSNEIHMSTRGGTSLYKFFINDETPFTHKDGYMTFSLIGGRFDGVHNQVNLRVDYNNNGQWELELQSDEHAETTVGVRAIRIYHIQNITELQGNN